jgi:hypothetical protein
LFRRLRRTSLRNCFVCFARWKVDSVFCPYFEAKGTRKHDWYTVSASGENPQKLSLPEHFEPVGFTKDGAALYGTYEVDKLRQLAVVPLAEGKATQIISVPNGVQKAIPNPDGSQFALLSDPPRQGSPR